MKRSLYSVDVAAAAGATPAPSQPAVAPFQRPTRSQDESDARGGFALPGSPGVHRSREPPGNKATQKEQRSTPPSGSGGEEQLVEATASSPRCDGGSVGSTGAGEVSVQHSRAPVDHSEAPWIVKAFSGAHSKSLWLYGRQRPEQLEKHLSDLRTKVSVGKVSLRNPLFPSAASAAAIMRAVSQIRRVTSFTLSAAEMPEEQFVAVCEELGGCSYLNHVDCNAIGSKPLHLREVNLSGNEFLSPGEAFSQGESGKGGLLDGFQLLKGLLLRGVLCLLARECGLRQLRQFLVWVLNRCHCLRLRQLDLGASSKLLTTVVPGETFDEELLRRVSQLSKSTWRMGKVIGDYAPSFQVGGGEGSSLAAGVGATPPPELRFVAFLDREEGIDR
ncbi:hypothetical protein cyc_03456 [Cyclospora cayetanensis]|uniref:Leucine rich repeat-containing protein n=1 Tax=Cyclospora cayetanensis TaxID=88456 RepID=A0A1D3D2W5_9EIME|nr:hypothetical protein cyc_03456 [Cyclospora cayetanensis]